MRQREHASGHQKRMAAIAAVASSIILVATGTAVWANGESPGDHTPMELARSGGPIHSPSAAPLAASPSVKPANEPRLGPVPVVRSGARIAMPLDSYMTPMSDIKLIDDATALKARDCMRSLGFGTWTAGTVSTSKPGDYKESDLLDYLDPSNVAQNGYPQTLVDKEKPPGQKNLSASKPGADAFRAFTGGETRTASGHKVTPGGCDAEGGRQVRTGSTDLPVDPRVLAMLAKFAAKRDSRMQSSFASWSTCMTQRGFHYNSPFNAQNDRRWGLRTAATPAGAEEKSVAAADAACQKSVNVVGTYKALESAYQKRSVDQYRAKLTTALAIFDKWTAHAKAIVAKG